MGARNRVVLSLLLRQSLGRLAVGLSVGLVVSLATARLLSSILFGVEPFDPTTFGAVATVIIATTSLAALLPSRRALALDPIRILRDE